MEFRYGQTVAVRDHDGGWTVGDPTPEGGLNVRRAPDGKSMVVDPDDLRPIDHDEMRALMQARMERVGANAEEANARKIEIRLSTASRQLHTLGNEMLRLAGEVRRTHVEGHVGPETDSAYTAIVEQALHLLIWGMTNAQIDDLVKVAHRADIGRNAGF